MDITTLGVCNVVQLRKDATLSMTKHTAKNIILNLETQHEEKKNNILQMLACWCKINVFMNWNILVAEC